MSLWKILVAGLVIHAIVFISVFDIYFSAIIIDGLPARSSPLPAPAKRLIFIVADGLRADKTFMLQPDGRSAAHYLRKLGETQGTWGVSIAGIPTATRPGHVALTAGFYEDPTSVAKDIHAAAITFDTVFKETRYTWTWDTPKFLEQVAKDHPDRIFSEQFPGERKYLSGIDPKDMDSWVFNEVSTFLKNARDDTDLKEKMNKDKVLFFLHLGGIDHAGYIVRPNSERYLQHLAFLDEGIKDIIEQFEDFFDHDKKTTYIFTSDHGMTNYGAHGDGTPHEILCPLITWGAGIRKPIPENDLSRYNDTLSQDWSLTEWKRADIEQPSLAPLMAASIGITYPRNAIYPIPDGFFDVSDEKLFEMFYANLIQLLDNYVAFERYTHRGPLAFQFRSYRPLSGVLITSLKTDIEAQKEAGNYAQALKLTKEKIELAVNGIQHYRLYSKVPLWLATFTSLVGWFCFCGLLLIQQMQHWEDIKVITPIMSNTKHIIIQCTVGLIVFDLIFLYAQSTPVTQCIHFLMPIPILAACILKWYEIGNIFPILKRQKELAPMGVVSVMVSICLAMVISYHRIFISLLILAVQLSYVYFGRKDLKKGLFRQWVFTSVVLAFLSGRPVGDRDLQYNLVLLGGVIATTAVFLFHMEMDGSAVKGRLCRNFGKRFAAYQILKLALATCVLYYSSYLTQNDIRTPPSVQITSWLILFVSLLEPFYVNTDIQSRLVAISFGLAAPYILLCTRQEVLGYIFLIWNQYLFIELESNITKAQPILLPRTTNEATNRIPNSSVSNGKSVTRGNVRHHKHTKSNDYLMWQPSVSEWQSLDFAGVAESDSHCKKLLTTGDIRRVLQFIILGFGSQLLEGHVVSINSFDPQDVFCFITVSNPPKMGALIMFKNLMPAFVIACFFSATNVITFTSTRNISIVLLMVTNLLCTIMFTCVTNVGTWTVIGASVSQFLISSGICMFACMYVGVSYVLTTFNISFVLGACFKLLARKLSKLQNFV